MLSKKKKKKTHLRLITSIKIDRFNEEFGKLLVELKFNFNKRDIVLAIWEVQNNNPNKLTLKRN